MLSGLHHLGSHAAIFQQCKTYDIDVLPMVKFLLIIEHINSFYKDTYTLTRLAS